MPGMPAYRSTRLNKFCDLTKSTLLTDYFQFWTSLPIDSFLQALAQRYNRQGSILACDFFMQANHGREREHWGIDASRVREGQRKKRTVIGQSDEMIHARALRAGWLCCRCRFLQFRVRSSDSGKRGSFCTRRIELLLEKMGQNCSEQNVCDVQEESA